MASTAGRAAIAGLQLHCSSAPLFFALAKLRQAAVILQLQLQGLPYLQQQARVANSISTSN